MSRSVARDARWLLAICFAALITAAPLNASTIVYNNTSTTLGAGSIPIFSVGDTTVNSLYEEVGDVVTLDPGTAPNRQLTSIRLGYFTADSPNDGVDDDRFIADFIFRIYPVDGAGEVIDSVMFERVVEDFLWFDGAFAQTIEFPQEVGSTLILPETFAYTLAVGDRVDDPDSAGDGLQTSFSFNSRGPIDVGSSPDGLLRRNSGSFETIVFGSGRQTRITINAGAITIPEPTGAILGTVALAGLAVRRR